MSWPQTPTPANDGAEMVANSIFRACVTSVVRLAYLPRLLLSVDVSCMF